MSEGLVSIDVIGLVEQLLEVSELVISSDSDKPTDGRVELSTDRSLGLTLKSLSIILYNNAVVPDVSDRHKEDQDDRDAPVD